MKRSAPAKSVFSVPSVPRKDLPPRPQRPSVLSLLELWKHREHREYGRCRGSWVTRSQALQNHDACHPPGNPSADFAAENVVDFCSGGWYKITKYGNTWLRLPGGSVTLAVMGVFRCMTLSDVHSSKRSHWFRSWGPCVRGALMELRRAACPDLPMHFRRPPSPST